MTRQAAIVTGSGRGIGLSAALALARKGFAIALNGLPDDEELDETAQLVAAEGAEVVTVRGDVSDISCHNAMLEKAEAAIGPLSTLVNNAGVSVQSRGDLLDVTEASYDRCMAINTKAHFFLSQAFARRLLARDRNDGRFYSLIAITSANARSVAVNRGEYATSKAAAAMIAQLFAVRLGAENIAVYDIQPGVIETDMTRKVADTYRRRIQDEGMTLIPRMGTPQDIGAVIATLASGGLPYTTGQVIAADGGMLVSRF